MTRLTPEQRRSIKSKLIAMANIGSELAVQMNFLPHYPHYIRLGKERFDAGLNEKGEKGQYIHHSKPGFFRAEYADAEGNKYEIEFRKR